MLRRAASEGQGNAASKLLEEVKAATPTSSGGGLFVPTPEGGGRIWINQPGRVSFEVVYEYDDKIKDLKAEVARVTGVPINKLTLLQNGEPIGAEGQLLRGTTTSDIWVLDERDESARPGYWSGPDEDDNTEWSGSKGFIYLVSFVTLALFAAQLAGYDALQIALENARPKDQPVISWQELRQQQLRQANAVQDFALRRGAGEDVTLVLPE